MSGLEKFQGTNAWLARFKNLLLMERNQATENYQCSRTINNTHTNFYNCSLDLSEDLRLVLEENKKTKENKGNLSSNFTESKMRTTKPKKLANSCNVIKINNLNEQSLKVEVCGETSFEALEKMCDKSVSDPDSTLFLYLKTMHEESVDTMKNASTCDSMDKSDDTLYVQGLKIFNKSSFADQTQLNDIEEPSMIWNNDSTISYDGMQLSSVKTIHMLRPSTIIEEISGTDSEISLNSFQTAHKIFDTNSGFETANETLSSLTKSNFNNLNYKKKSFFDSNKSTSSEQLSSTGILSEENLNYNIVLPSFQNYVTHGFTDTDQNNSLELSIKNSSIIELSNELNSVSEFNTENDGSIMNSKDESLNFNDTIEEMEYIMSKGLQYLNGRGSKSPMLVTNVQLSPTKSSNQNNLHSLELIASGKLNPVISKKQNYVDEKAYSNTQTTSTSFKKPNPNVKNIYTLKKKNDMKHIISPVGAYIRKTPLTPTFTSIKPTFDVFNSKVIRDLEFDYVKNQKGESLKPSLTSSKQQIKCRLPKKAYISAEFKHVTDERTPINIPGGDKIHRYLHQSKIPSVIRHDGKLKINDIARSDYNFDHKEGRSINKSLADLSLMSGDVSIYTIKDAQKFTN